MKHLRHITMVASATAMLLVLAGCATNGVINNGLGLDPPDTAPEMPIQEEAEPITGDLELQESATPLDNGGQWHSLNDEPPAVHVASLPHGPHGGFAGQGFIDLDNDGAESEGEDEAQPLPYELEFEDRTVEEAMFELMFGQRYRIYGRHDMKITASIYAIDLADALRQLEDQTDVLVSKRGNMYIVYCEGAEHELGEQSVNYLYQCRRAKAPDLIAVIEGNSPAGFPTSDDPTPDRYSVPTHGTAATTGAMAQGVKKLSEALGQTEYQVVHHLNGIMLKGTIREVRRAVHFLQILDTPIDIVMVELLIVQYAHDDEFTWRYNLFDAQIARGMATTDSTTALDLSAGNIQNYGTRPWGVTADRMAFNSATGNMPMNFSALGTLTTHFRHNLQLLCNEELARVVTNPRIAIVSGHKGTILLDETFNFFTTVENSQTGTVSQKAQKLDAVTALTVTPTILGPDRIHMALNATLGTFVGNVSGVTNTLPDQRTNEIATSVVMADNETLAIGGLIREDMNEDRDKIPGAAKIPLFGYLFRGKENSYSLSETVIYVTPHLDMDRRSEDDYLKEIYKQTQRLQERGELVRTENRLDRYRSHSLYKNKEYLDTQQHKQQLQEHLHSTWHGYPPIEAAYPVFEGTIYQK